MKLKDFFKPSYRVMPVYQGNRLAGCTVQVRHWWTGIWFTAQLHTIGPEENVRWIPLSDALFPTAEEAKQYIESRKTHYR